MQSSLAQLHACSSSRKEEREGSWKGGRRSWETEGRIGEEEEQLRDRREERRGGHQWRWLLLLDGRRGEE